MTDHHHDATQAARDLANDLLRELTPLIGDQAAIDETCRRWLHVLGGPRLGLVCAAAVRATFADCLTETPITAIPTGAVAFVQPMEIQ